MQILEHRRIYDIVLRYNSLHLHRIINLHLHSFNHSYLDSILRLFFTSASIIYKRFCLVFKFSNMNKKNLLLIFGLLGLVSLMAESGPKRSSILSKLGLDKHQACCDMSDCCVDDDINCCNVSNCCMTVSNCCATASSCCTSENIEQESKIVEESEVSRNVAESKGK
jgi:hypothetical protein